MPTCSRENATRYLAGLFNAAEEAAFVDHLEICCRCRELLEDSSGEEDDWQAARELLSYSRECVPAPAAQHSSSTAPPNGAVLTEAAWAVETVDPAALSFLAPSDDPQMIGRVGPYEISGFLGRGAMGLVLKGFDRALNRNVAVKVLDPAVAGAGAARQRFAREARAMAAISHEHVVPVYGVDEHAGLPYFVMEYVAGGSLERRLKSDGSFDVVSIVRIGLQAAQALAAAHGHGLVHRDIKPGNILIDRGTERVRVADFGLARIANDVSCTHSGFIAGTPQYMAPEQIRGESCTAQSDLFSLGGVLYALCTGHAPFRAESVYGVMQRIVHDPPRSIREQNPAIPAWLEVFVLKLLDKDKTARFASADFVVRILQEELAHLQNPGSTSEPARRWSVGRAPPRAARKQPTALAACVVFAAVVAFVTRDFWLPAAARQDTQETNAKQVNAVAAGSRIGADEPTTDLASWGVEDTLRASELASTLAANWHAPSTSPTADPWSVQAAELRRRLAKLSAEFGTTDTPIP
jgi:hypothetical protein